MARWVYLAYISILFMSATVSLGMAFYVWGWRRLPGASSFGVLTLAASWWSLSTAYGMLSDSDGARMFWLAMQQVGLNVMPVAWPAFVFNRVGMRRWLTRRCLLLLSVVPLLNILIAWTNGYHHLMWRSISPETGGAVSVLTFEYGVWFWVTVAYLYGALSLAVLLVFRQVIRRPSRLRRRAPVVLSVVLIPWAVDVLYLWKPQVVAYLDPTPTSFLLTVLAFGWGLYNVRLLDVLPVARSVIVNGMHGGVLLLDAEGYIRDANPAALTLFGLDLHRCIGLSVAEVLPIWRDWMVQGGREVGEFCTEVTLDQAGQPCTCDVRVSPLYGRKRKVVGYLLVFRDVTEQRRTEEMLRRRERFLRCVADISQLLLQEGDLDVSLPRVLQRIGETAEVCRVVLFENHSSPTGQLVCSIRCEWRAEGVPSLIGSSLSTGFDYVANGAADWMEALSQGEVVVSRFEHLSEPKRRLMELCGVRALMLIPLFVFDSWYGFIGLHLCHRERDWLPAEVDLLRVAAGDIAGSIERDLSRNRSQAMTEAVAAITSTLDFEQILDRILEQVGRVVPNDAANVMLVEGDGARIVRWRGYERFGVEDFVASLVLPIKTTPNLQRMMESREPMVIPDTFAYDGWVRIPVQDWLRSYASAPIVVRDEVVGFLNVDSAIPGFFSRAYLEPLRTFAGYAAAAIENARLFQAERRQTRRLALLADIARIVATTPDTDAMLQEVARSIQHHFAYQLVMFFLLDREAAVLRLRGYAGGPSVEVGDKRLITPSEYVQAVGEGIIGHAVSTGRPYYAPDTAADPYFLPVDAGVQAELCVPIVDDEMVIGALDVESDRVGAFNEYDISVLEAVADAVATGLRNICLYEETRSRVQELTLLNQISARLGESRDREVIINYVLGGVFDLLRLDRAFFVAADVDAGRWEITHGRDAEGMEAAIGLSGTFEEVPSEARLLLAWQPFVSSDVEAEPALGRSQEIYRRLGIQSLMLVPVRVRERLLGVLGVAFCCRKHRWRPDEVRLLEGVAHQLELALENALLIEEAYRRNAELEAALARQEELDLLKDEFIQNVSHELRTPLALILGYAEMLAGGDLGELGPEQRKPINIIARRARMLSSLVEDITLILEAEASPPRPRALHLDALALDAVDDFQVAAERAGLTIRAEVEPDLPPVRCVPVYLRRVLDNLLGNAAKFTPEGGRVTVRVWRDGGYVALAVSDTGVGIPSEQLERIFERFYQVDGSARRKYGGVGLGLALVKEIVEAYGGSVTVESEVGRGSTFTVRLPVADET